MITLFFRWVRRIAAPRVGSGLKLVLALATILWFSASGFMYFEIQEKPDLTWADAFWWSLVTMTTVGYGDYFPQTVGGRYLVGVPTMIFGISVLGYLLSSVANYLLESKSKELKGMKQIKVGDHILIVHFSNVNRILQLARALQADPATRHKPIVLIDSELEELPAKLVDIGVKFVHGNPAREATLERANYQAATHAMVLSKDPRDVRSDDLNLAVAMTIEGLKSSIRTVVECVDADSIEILRRTGCDSIVCGSRFSSALMVQEMVDPGVQAVLSELSQVQLGHQIYCSEIADMTSWRFAELAKWARSHHMTAIGIRRADDDLVLNPDDDQQISADDTAIVIARKRPGRIDTTSR